MDELKTVIDGADDLLTASLITQVRIYDALITLLRTIDPVQAKALVKAHEAGILLAPPPAFVGEV